MLYEKNKTDRLSAELFKDPTSEYQGTPFWSWNGEMEEAECVRQAHIFREMGFGGYHMHPRSGLSTPYLNDKFMSCVKACVEDAKASGMLAWLYDEDRYPSGFAGGAVTKDGKAYKARSPRDAKAHGLALLTEERRATGIFGILPILENTVIANQKNYARMGVLDEHRRVEEASAGCKELNVKMPSLHTLIQDLSGGNQQKVLIARWLLTNSDILILDEPTRGIDVGAKYEIYNIMLQQVNNGKSIIMISSEMPELMGMSDRIVVMCEGRVTGILEKGQYSQEEIMRLATMFASHRKDAEDQPAAD